MPELFSKFLVLVLFFQINCILAEVLRAVFGRDGLDDKGITVKENHPLELICFLDKETIFIHRDEEIYPWSKRHVSSYQTIVSNSAFEESRRKYKAVVRFDEILYGDSGEYWCGDLEMNIKLIYMIIYVKSDESFFAENNIVSRPKISFDRNEMSKREKRISLNCYPTLPSFEMVHLLNMKEIDYSNRYKNMRYMEPSYPGVYTCQLKKDGCVVAEKSFEVVDAKCPISKPKITGYQLPHATRNQSLRMNCTIEDNFLFRRNLSWNVRETNRITIRKYSIPNSEFANCMTMIEEVELKHVTDDDVGEFRCNISDGKSDLESAAMKLRIHDANFTKCKLSARNSYKGIITKDVEVVVLIDSYPHQPEITWKDQNANATIKQKEKFVVDTNETQTKLTIKNFSLSDEGNYTVEAKTPDHLVSKSIRLEVWENPFVKCLNNAMPYYMQNTTAKIDCITSHDPNLHITWKFEPDSLSPSSMEKIKDMTFTSNNKTVTWTIQASGNLSCEACTLNIDNKKECYTVIQQIFMTDISDGFGIIGPKEKLFIGDRLELICAASIYYYTDQTEWKNSDGLPLDTTGRITIRKIRTPLHYGSLLIIDPAEATDNNVSYICSSKQASKRMDEDVNSRTYVLVVRVPELQIYRTNLNGTESLHRVGTSIDLWCHVEGKPEPKVTWWKNENQILDTTPIQTEVCNYRLGDDGQRLHIESAEKVCEGFYSCRGTNRFNMSVANNRTIKIELSEVESSEKTIFTIVIVISIAAIIIMFLSFIVYIRIEMIRVNEKLREMCLENFAKGVPQSLNPELTVEQQAAFLPYDAKYEFPVGKLEFGKILGKGNYGTVIKAKASKIRKGEIVTTVAVKTTEPKYIKDLANELKIMVYLGNHVNLVSLLGACTKNIVKGELLVITEFCCFGSLHNCLQRHKPNFINQIDLATGKIDFSMGLVPSGQSTGNNKSKLQAVTLRGPMSNHSSIYGTHIIDQEDDAHHDNFPVLNTYVLLWWSWQIARGMDYLAGKRVLHRDLAARNILLAEGNVVKICDFGLSKSLPDKDYYRVSTRDELPSAWLSLESLDSKIFTTESDVWTFGVVLWELFTLGQRPYDDRNWDAICEFLKGGNRLEIPNNANEDIYNIMKQCWDVEPKLRPTFHELMKRISILLDKNEKTLLTDLKKFS